MSRFRFVTNTFALLTFALLTFGLCLGLGFSAVAAQEETLEGLQVRWTELQIQYAKKEAEISAGGENAKQLQGDYRELISQGNALIGKMKQLALANLKENPNDSSTARLLMGILVNDVSNGEEQSVLRIGDELISLGINPLYFETAAKADRLNITGREIFEELVIRQQEAKQDDLPRIQLETTKGKLVLELYENQAPNTVNNFVSLVESGHFSDTQFHRVIDGFMAQAGQNKGDGKPVPELDYTIACECYTPETRRHFSDSVSMAHGGKDSGAGQFFITFSRRSHLDGKHTCFGRVIEGMELLDKIERTASAEDIPIPNASPDKILSAKVLRKREHQYKPKKLGQEDKESSETETTKDEKPVAEEADNSKSGSDKSGSDKSGSDKSGSDKSGSDKSGSDKSEAEADDSESEMKAEKESDSSGSKTDEKKSDAENSKGSESKKSEGSEKESEDKESDEADSDLELPDSSDGG